MVEDKIFWLIVKEGERILRAKDIADKAQKAISLYEHVQKVIESTPDVDVNKVVFPVNAKNVKLDRSTRPDLTVVAPSRVEKRGAGGVSNDKLVNTLHALAHMESWAIDLSFDILIRYVEEQLPLSFFLDWLRVGWDEARHFELLSQRLEELGSFYGAKSVHDGLWESAMETADSLLSRLAIMHIVHEVGPWIGYNAERLRSKGDKKSAEALDNILNEEVLHVAFGVKWFRYLAERDFRETSVERLFHNVVLQRFRGPLKEPFNVFLRDKAELPSSWYRPLVQREQVEMELKQADQWVIVHKP